MLTNSMWQSFHNIYVYQIIIVHLDLVNVVCQFYLNKAGGGGGFFSVLFKNFNESVLLLNIFKSY